MAQAKASPAKTAASTRPESKPAPTETGMATVVKKKGRAPVDPNETKEQKLMRLGQKRVEQALTKIRLIGNLSAYRPTPEQTDRIMTALGESCARLEARLRGTRQESYTFTMR